MDSQAFTVGEYQDMTMPWGKHKGQAIRAIPTDYLDWCLKNCTKLRPYLQLALQAELDRRLGGQPSAPRPSSAPAASTPPVPPVLADMLDLVDGWYRCLCRQHHPDRGGSPQVMAALNNAYQDLRRRVRRAVGNISTE